MWLSQKGYGNAVIVNWQIRKICTVWPNSKFYCANSACLRKRFSLDFDQVFLGKNSATLIKNREFPHKLGKIDMNVFDYVENQEIFYWNRDIRKHLQTSGVFRRVDCFASLALTTAPKTMIDSGYLSSASSFVLNCFADLCSTSGNKYCVHQIRIRIYIH